MLIHQKIKEEIAQALRSRDTTKLETLRSVLALFVNEIMAGKVPPGTEFIPDERALALIKRSVNQRKDSIEQFILGKRPDLAEHEKAELAILQSYLPDMMSRDEIRKFAETHINNLKALGVLDTKAVGKITGIIMKELSGKADGGDVKAAVEAILSR